MYGKVFSSMYDGTLATKGPWQALVTFQQMIVLADKDGVVDMTADAISRRTSIPIEIIRRGISELSMPDDESRSPIEDGRRIVLLEEHRTWGWQIVNYAKYAALRSAEERREYMRIAQAEHRARVKAKAEASKNVMTSHDEDSDVNLSTHVPVPVPVPVDAVNLEPTVLVDSASQRPRIPRCPTEKILEGFHRHLPMLPQVVVVNPSRKSSLSSRWREVVTADKMDEAAGVEWFSWYWQHVGKSKFLTGRTNGHGGRVWKADFDWLLKPTNFAKTVEGNYHKDQI